MALTREQFIQAVMEYSRAMFRAARAVLDSDADAEDAVDIDAVAGVSFGAGRNGRGGALAVQLMQRAAGDVPPPLFFRPPLAIRAFFLYNITD